MIWSGVTALCRLNWPFGALLLSADGCHNPPRKFEFKQKGSKTARGLTHPTGWAALPLITYQGVFFKGGKKNPLMI
jgi:hypothetical protein